MGREKLDSLLWEQNIFDNYIVHGAEIIHENMGDVFWDEVDELKASRDDDYNVTVTCKRHINRFGKPKPKIQNSSGESLPGESVPEGKIKVKIFEDWVVEFSPCYFEGYESKLDMTDYKITCYRIEGKRLSREPRIIKEWIINGNPRGLHFYNNSKFEYKVEGKVFGKYGDMEFPTKQAIPEFEYYGRFIHIKYKDTAFDVHYVGDSYGPKWSTNLSISYNDKYGKIPDVEERKIIRDYLSFFVGKCLVYTGESSYDENGNVIGFVMETPRTFGMNIKSVCANAAKAPINDEHGDLRAYFTNVQKYIDVFDGLYRKLDFEFFFTSYWYAKEIVKPIDLLILASALEHLKKKWYEEVEANPETVLMDKKDFVKRIKPIKELVVKQFEGTEYSERMQRSIDSMNRMTINEQLTHFFIGIGMPIGDDETEAIRARNFSAHGSFRDRNADYHKQCIVSQVYECLLTRVILKLLKYDGKYVDYGTIGYPEKDIDCPCGNLKTTK